MEIYPILEIKRGLTALIGGGGKTTLMLTLARELRRQGTVIVTTSTHIMAPEGMPLLLRASAEDVRAALDAHGVVCVADRSTESGKLSAPELGFDTLASLADFVLVEADGSKRLPLKAHAPHEPVIPPCAEKTVYVLGADGFGRSIHEACHRPERYAALCGGLETDIVTPQRAAQVLLAEGYGAGLIYINKVETQQNRLHAEMVAAMLPGSTVAGSLRRGTYQKLS